MKKEFKQYLINQNLSKNTINSYLFTFNQLNKMYDISYLTKKKLLDYKLVVSSLLRTEEDVKRLRRSGNPNASDNSAHCYGTTFDIAHNNFNPSPKLDKNPGTNLSDNELKHILAHVLFRLRMQKKCWVLIEERQKCFPITVNS